MTPHSDCIDVNKSLNQGMETVQYEAALAITVIIIGTSKQGLGFEI